MSTHRKSIDLIISLSNLYPKCVFHCCTCNTTKVVSYHRFFLVEPVDPLCINKPVDHLLNIA